MGFLQPHLECLATHLYAVVFAAFLIEAAGLPFPSRIILIIAATISEGAGSFATLVALSAIAAVVGDHVPYLVGKLMGPRLLALACSNATDLRPAPPFRAGADRAYRADRRREDSS